MEFNSKLNVVKSRILTAPSLNLRAVPYIGIYDSSYALMDASTIIKPIDMNTVKNFPKALQKVISDYEKNYPNEFIDFFVINHDTEPLSENLLKKESYYRFNFVIHPYVFQDVPLEYDAKIRIVMSLYKIDPSDEIHEDVNCCGYIPIDDEN